MSDIILQKCAKLLAAIKSGDVMHTIFIAGMLTTSFCEEQEMELD
jgi:hypothetical protein